jgi:type IV pilus assembly protein PilY1
MRKWIVILMAPLALGLAGASILMADDTDLYVAGVDNVQPNCLIIFDNSGSMNNEMPSVEYDSTCTYPNVLGVETPNTVYYKSGGKWDTIYRESIAQIQCTDARDALSIYGYFNGRLDDDTECGGRKTWYLRTGNYRNYLEYTGPAETRPRLGVAKGTVQSFINTTWGVRFGAMIFNQSEGGHILREIKDMTPQNRASLHNAIGQIYADTWTPLAETLHEAGLYFQGALSYFNPEEGVYNSPIQYWCQRSYIIIVTDGESTMDRNEILKSHGRKQNGDTDIDEHEPGLPQEKTYEDDGSDYLDDVAKVIREIDARPDLEDNQNIVTYTVGFTIRSELLEDTAGNGGGKYYYCHNAQSFSIALQKIIEEILEQSSSYVAPVVPISQMEKASSGNRIYLALFKPAWRSFWKGNIKKFAIATEDDLGSGIQTGDIIDFFGGPVLDLRGHILDSAVSFWGTPDPDGGEVEKGGVGQLLLTRSSERMIYTYMGITADLTDLTNAFTLDNPEITPLTLGFREKQEQEKQEVIKFIHGYDSYDENGNGNTEEKRDWILGAFLHSRPLVIHYGQGRSVIYAGANDGMLHAFDDETGEELWAFIPPNLLERLRDLTGEAIEYYVDGSPRAYIIDQNDNGIIESSGDDRVVLAFGQRRGGDRFFALDVTSPQSPNLLWQIGPEMDGYLEMGQSWSTPIVGKIRYGMGEKMVFFIGGGYDENQDSGPSAGEDIWGKAIYIVDAVTGELLWKYSHADNPFMAHSIPSDIARVDTTGDGYIDRLYVGDMGGKMWRFDIGTPGSWAGKIIFDSGEQRKIYYPPDVCLENGGGYYEMLFFGTGDRADPKDITICNRIYAVKDRNGDPLSESDLQDVTDTLLDGTDTDNGWYIRLNQHLGEKVLSTPIVYFGGAYFTTFIPDDEQSDDLCYVGQGRARLYALGYKTGNPVFDLDGLGETLEIGDRSAEIGVGIPSGVVIAIFGEIAKGYVGVGGGIYRPPVSNKSTILPMWWREIF